MSAQSSAFQLYVVVMNRQLYVFDRRTHRNLTKMQLRDRCQTSLVYQKSADVYFLFVIYESMDMEIQTLVYLSQNQLRTVVQKSVQTINIKTNSSIRSKFTIKNLYVQPLVSQPNALFYSAIIKTTITDKSNLFVKTLLKYDNSQKFFAQDQVNLLYLNLSTSLIQPCQYQEKILFFINNRAYLTRNLRVCDAIYEVDGKILAAAF